jgi:hypothetical protein
MKLFYHISLVIDNATQHVEFIADVFDLSKKFYIFLDGHFIGSILRYSCRKVCIAHGVSVGLACNQLPNLNLKAFQTYRGCNGSCEHFRIALTKACLVWRLREADTSVYNM